MDQDQRGDVHGAAAAEERPGQGDHDQAENDPALGRGQGQEVAGRGRQAGEAGQTAQRPVQTITQQLPEEHTDGGCGDGPEHGRAGAMHFQLDAHGGQFQAQYRVGHGQYQQSAEKGGLETIVE